MLVVVLSCCCKPVMHLGPCVHRLQFPKALRARGSELMVRYKKWL